MKKLLLFFPVLFMLLTQAHAREISVTVHKLNNVGLDKSIGVIVARETQRGLELQPFLKNMEPGTYRFSVNENIGCGVKYKATGIGIPGMAAGNEISQLPALKVDEYGNADTAVIAGHLQLKDILGRTLVISRQHSSPFDLGGDDENRIACGTLELNR